MIVILLVPRIRSVRSGSYVTRLKGESRDINATHAVLFLSLLLTTFHSNAAHAVINNRGIANTLQSPFMETFIHIARQHERTYILITVFVAIERIISRDECREWRIRESGIIFKFVQQSYLSYFREKF